MAGDLLARIFGTCRLGFTDHNQFLFGLALCLPLIGHFFGLKTMHDHYGRPGFGWRIALNIVLVGGLTLAGLAMAMNWTRLSPAAAAQQVRCQPKN